MLRPDDGGPTGSALSLSHLQVDLDGLADFKTVLQHELTKNLRPTVDRINSGHSLGVAFGHRNPGVGMQEARTRYRDALAVSTHNLAYYVRTSELLIQAIQTLATNYRESDLSAQAILKAIQDANEAMPPLAPIDTEPRP